MPWLAYALGTALALALADFCVKLASGKLSNSLGLLIYGTSTFLAGAGWVLWQRAAGAPLFVRMEGVWPAVGVGVAFSAVTVGLYATFGAGAPISLAAPTIRLGGLLLASAAGVVLLREPLTARYVVGVLLAVGGMYLIVTR